MHTAYNLITGEIVVGNTANHLKRVVAYNSFVNNYYYNSSNKWVFAHGKNAIEKVCGKANTYYKNVHH